MRRTLAAARHPTAHDAGVVRLQELHLQRDLLKARLAAQLLLQAALHPRLAVDRLHHVHRDADRARLVGDGAADRLANPPGGVGAEFEAERVVELIDRTQQAKVAFLDQVEEVETAPDIAFGNADHKA